MGMQQHAFVAACYGHLGDKTAAGAHVAQVGELDPEFSFEKLKSTLHYAREEDTAHLREGLEKAGLTA